MSETQFPNQTRPKSIVFPTEGLAPQEDNPWNRQAQTVETGEASGAGDVPAQYGQSFGQHDENNTLYSSGKFPRLCHRYDRLCGSWATETKEVFSDDLYADFPNQGIQNGTFESSNNAGVQTLQGAGFEEVARQIRYVYGLQEMYYPPSGGAPSPYEDNAPARPVTVPSIMRMAAENGNAASLEHYDNFNLQVGSALPPSNGLVLTPPGGASNQYTDQAAYSSLFHSLYNNPWATHTDTSALGPEVQTEAPRMNTVTPCAVYRNSRGGDLVSAAAHTISRAPGPTPTTNNNVHEDYPLGTASTYPPHDTESGSHRSSQQTHAPKAVGCNRTRRSTPTPRGEPQGRGQTAKPPAAPYEKNVNALADRLLKEGADPEAVEILRTKVFNNGVTERALMAKFIHREKSTNHSSVKSKYRLLLEHTSPEYSCLLCHQDSPAKYKNCQDSLRHLRKDHFGFASICHCGW